MPFYQGIINAILLGDYKCHFNNGILLGDFNLFPDNYQNNAILIGDYNAFKPEENWLQVAKMVSFQDLKSKNFLADAR